MASGACSGGLTSAAFAIRNSPLITGRLYVCSLMITYNPKDWFTFIFRLHKAETFRQLLPLMVGVTIYSGAIGYFEFHTWYSDETRELTKAISTIYSILGFTLSLLLVFRTNSAYDRWWEGRKLWGDLTNNTRAFASHMNAILPKEDSESRQMLSLLLATFPYALQAHLKNEKIDDGFYDKHWLSFKNHEYYQRITNTKHQPLEVFRCLMEFVAQLSKAGKLNGQSVYHFKTELNKLIDVCGACERIKNTPIPFSYSVFLKKFIFFYVMLFPWIYSTQMVYFIAPVTVFVLYVLTSIELIAEEIENPFNGDPNDLPTLEMAVAIGGNAERVLVDRE
jgi:putative membrane protein